MKRVRSQAARRCEAVRHHLPPHPCAGCLDECVTEMIRAAVEAERKACAVIADSYRGEEYAHTALCIATAIRARGRP